uniref:Uncharacterized protein n=1 Tax=virus sp. ctkyY8 TaxID=2827995 RepID=A0A8S5RED2_9VIRU|nr:MAG TPA: hypothetical protein [virus sp. ctkyY8]
MNFSNRNCRKIMSNYAVDFFFAYWQKSNLKP